jgi:hypothetical protein
MRFLRLEAAVRFPAVCLLIVPLSWAATLVVPDDYATIQGAINASVNGDTVLVLQGTYYENIDFLDRNIVLTSDDWSDSGVIIDGAHSGSVVSITGGQDSSTKLEGFTIINGSGYLGGGVLCVNSSPVISNNYIHSNQITSSGANPCGGGIYAANGSPSVVNNVIQSNFLHSTYLYGNPLGAGIYAGNCANITILGNTITGNNASASVVSHGGGVALVSCTGAVDENLILSNYAAFGGGLFVSGHGSLAITSNLISGNQASDGAGAFFAGASPLCTVQCNTIVYNNGGGVTVNGDGPAFNNDLICRNSFSGLFIYECSTMGEIRNITVTENVGAYERIGGITLHNSSATIRNCILYSNSSYQEIRLESGSSLAVDYSCVENGEAGAYVESGSTLNWGVGNIDEDPCFDADWPDSWFLDPAVPSPCIDAGNPDPAYDDPEDPLNPGYALWPALGLLRNDMGAYGGGGPGGWVGIGEEPTPPVERALIMAFPNPCASVSTLMYELPEPAVVEMRIFDLSGRTIRTFAEGSMTAGVHAAVFDGSGLPSGVYLCWLRAGALFATTRIVLIR